ncbi:MAG: T9SS type A sorting domain-containing protein [bacterium]|nr:T9SS type A sorting domain-containing protein [bacterium]
MKRSSIFITSLFIFSFLSINLTAQYGPQFDNRGFEQWTYRVSEPTHWHSGGTATGTFASWVSSQIEQSSQTRPGSSGTKSVRLYPESVLGITANGNLTNGRMNAGSMSATGSGNYNYTQRSQTAFNTPITQLPDSLTLWVCFRSQSTSAKAQVKAVVHGNADYKIIADGTEEPMDMHVATALSSFTRTSAANGAYTWRRLSIPFNNNGPCTDVRYILMTATTNETPGSGSTSDDLFLDDLLLVYTPTLTLNNLEQTQFEPNEYFTINFTLTGTMSPDNLNAEANVVIAQLSDANGNFNNPVELGRTTTNTSGVMTARTPDVPAGTNYRIRVISTNYPMVGGNIQTVAIAPSAYTIAVTANPSNAGSVTGGGTYNQGQSCTVTATANTGFTFTNWTENGDVVSTNANYTFTVNSNRNLVANFTENTYTVTVSANPSNGGTAAGGGTFTHGQSCTVTATANTGYTFTNWTENGSVVSSDANYTFTVEDNRSLVANFTAITYTITVSANPSNSGTTSGGGTYNHGQSCTVIATSADGYTFMNWTENGTVVSTDANYTFVVTSNRSLVANFEEQLPDTYNINVSPNPNIGGTVTGGGTYAGGQQCTVTATANTGYTFINWTENGEVVTTNASYTFIVEGNRTLVANFMLNNYTISVTADPTDGGMVTGAGNYVHGTTCTLTATANENYEFINWTKDGVEVSTEVTFTFIVTASETYVAHFNFDDYVIENASRCQIYPNPFTDVLRITTDNIAHNISVYDLYGRLLKKQEVSSSQFELDLSEFSAGTYLLQVDYGDSRSVHRIMKAE